MTKEKTYFKASTLVEALIAGTLFMTVFLIAMNSISAILSIPGNVLRIEIENAMASCTDRYITGTRDIISGSMEYIYDWGTISVSGKQYNDNVICITASAELTGGHTVTYKCLRHYEYAE